MKTIMEIIGIELRQKAPMNRTEFDIFELKAIPISLVKSKNEGSNILDEVGLGRFSGVLETMTEGNEKTFLTIIPVARKEKEIQGYDIGKQIMVEVNLYGK